MKTILLLSLSLCICSMVVAQNRTIANAELLIQTDTVQIAPSVDKMIFKYFGNDEGYDFSDHNAGKMLGRFEIYIFGDSVPFQADTVFNIWGIHYEDADFDNVLDINIINNVGNTGDKTTNYYFYNPVSHKFEFGIGDLSNPSVNKKDSTISSGGSCCQGRQGGGEVLKLINHTFKKIQESYYSEGKSYTKDLIGDSLAITSLENVTGLGNNLLADSSWEYLFGKLRIAQVELKKLFEVASTSEQQDSGIADEDVKGKILYFSSESYQYTKGKDGILRCSFTHEVVKNKHWETVTETEWVVKD